MSAIDDSFRTLPIPDGRGLRMAMCPKCAEPLVSTLEFRGAEFICMGCRGLFGFMAPLPAAPTSELKKRHEELRLQYETERAARQEISDLKKED